MYACINILTKLMYFPQIIYLLGVNKYYGYGYGYGYTDWPTRPIDTLTGPSTDIEYLHWSKFQH